MFSDRLQVTAWLATLVLSVALISHVLDQPHHLTLIVMLVYCGMIAVDWFSTPRKGE